MALVYGRETHYLALNMDQLKDIAAADRRRSGRRLRWVVAAILVVLLVPFVVILYFVETFNPDQYAPAIIAAVDQATGRQLTLGGPITVRLSLSPIIEASGLKLSNPPGFADPDLLTLDRVEARIALLPLLSHHLDILQLVLERPNIMLESNKAGMSDWDFSPASPAQQPATAPQHAPGQNPAHYSIALEAVEIRDGLLTLKTNGPAAPITIALPNLTGTADSLAAPLHLTAHAVLDKTPFDISGAVGPIERFSGVGSAPWPIDLTVQMGGATGTLQGTLTHPRTAQGYDIAAAINIPALENLSGSMPIPFLAGVNLPPIHGITATARIVDQNSTIPAIDNLAIKAGTSDLSSLRPGLTLSALDIEMASLDQPLSVSASGAIGSTPLTFTGHFGPPQALVPPALLPATMPPQVNYAIATSAAFGAAKITLGGAIATPETLAGAALALSATIPDLSALSPLAGMPLPAWKNIAAQTTVIDPGGLGLSHAVGLTGTAVTLDNGAFGGDASLYFGPQPRLQLAAKFSQLNLDALLAAASPATPSASNAPSPAPRSDSSREIPNIQMPLGLVKSASADMQISADTLIWNQATYTALQAHALLAGGVFTLSPVTGQLPGGGISASATLNATTEPAAETLKLNAPALALSPFLKAFNLPNSAQGTVQAQLSATSTGDSLPAMAAGLNGQLGLAMVNGEVDGSVMDILFGHVLATVGMPSSVVGGQGPVAVRCAAVRMDATNGIGTIKALTLDTSRLLMQGGGTVDFGNETLGVILRPQLQVAGTDVGVPVGVDGSFTAPTTRVAPLGAIQEAAKSAVGLPVGLAQQVLGNNSLLGRAASALGIGNGGDVCQVALNLGRLGQPGPAAPPMPAAPSVGSEIAPALSGPKNLLNTLFGK